MAAGRAEGVLSVLPKIEALIARAVHPDTPVEEARTSAVIALRLIREHEIKLVEKGTAPRFIPSGHSPYGPFGPAVEDILDMIFRNDQRRPWAAEAAQKSKTRGRPRKKRAARPGFETCPHGIPIDAHCAVCDYLKKNRNKPQTRRVWTATCPALTYPNKLTCACCRITIYPGDKMCWAGDETVSLISPLTHERCVAHWATSTCLHCGQRTD